MNLFAETLLSWYDQHKRSMPWRDIRNPYATWVSEIMLQQTRVETVVPYFLRFMADFPDLKSLAEAEEDDVLKHWEGLGYYSRARNLHAAAKQVMADYGGALPSQPELLQKIKGVGAYTAGAIASIAFGVTTPAVDGNVIRVISRIEGIRENAMDPAVKQKITEQVTQIIPPDRPGDFNQALMDLGATICVPGTPDCGSCPMRDLCSACAAGDAEELPNLPQRTPPKRIPWHVLLVRKRNSVLVHKRTESMLNGLWTFVMIPGTKKPDALSREAERLTGISLENLRVCGTARHVFTHQIWEMQLWHADAASGTPRSDWRFVTQEEMDGLALPSAMNAARRKAFEPVEGKE